MSKTRYSFEKYPDGAFPVYSSLQKNKGTLVTVHYHKDCEFFKILFGNVKAVIDNKTFDLTEGDIVFLSPLTVHEVIAEREAALQGFVFAPSVVKSEIDVSYLQNTYYIFDKSDKLYGKTDDVFRSLTDGYLHRDKKSYRINTIANILLGLGVLIDVGVICRGNTDVDTIRTKRAVEYIHGNYQNNITVSDLAEMSNMCSDHFIRVFKKEHKKTPSEYISDYRIYKALNLLSDPEVSVSRAAEATGFSGSGYFIKVFRKKIGITPYRYKKNVNGFD